MFSCINQQLGKLGLVKDNSWC